MEPLEVFPHTSYHSVNRELTGDTDTGSFIDKQSRELGYLVVICFIVTPRLDTIMSGNNTVKMD